MLAVRLTILVSLLLAGGAQGLYVGSSITAYRVAGGLITVDGKIDPVWKELGAQSPDAVSTIVFPDYGKIVLLADSLRNRPPEPHYSAPSSGSVSMLAAYDQSFLYFLFIVRENNAVNPVTAGCASADLWKPHAVDVFVDPSAWSETLYAALFSADNGQVSYGTSAKTIEVAKPIWPGEARRFYRDRTVGNTFQVRTQLPSQLAGTSAPRTAADSLTLAVELRIPIASADYPAGKSMYISWGYNHYAGRAGGCDELPVAYRWAKHVKSYENVSPKPPGWSPGDSVHFDPLRSYDGWGRLLLSGNPQLQGTSCFELPADTDWDLVSWRSHCKGGTVTTRILPAKRDPSGPSPIHGFGEGIGRRDIRGRWHRGAAALFLIPPGAPGDRDRPMAPFRLPGD